MPLYLLVKWPAVAHVYAREIMFFGCKGIHTFECRCTCKWGRLFTCGYLLVREIILVFLSLFIENCACTQLIGRMRVSVCARMISNKRREEFSAAMLDLKFGISKYCEQVMDSLQWILKLLGARRLGSDPNGRILDSRGVPWLTAFRLHTQGECLVVKRCGIRHAYWFVYHTKPRKNLMDTI